MLKFIGDLRSLLLALWLGAACFFSFAVAPSAFGILASREMAGSVVSRTLLIVNLSGIVIGAILLLTSFLPSRNAKTFAVWIERILLVLLTIGCVVGQFVIALWMGQIRTTAGKAIEELAEDDALRIQFNQFHEYSIYVLGAAMIAAALSYFLLAYRSRNTENTTVKPTSKDLPDFKF
jgi:beta-lactamase regulating signal transducer with metallopeptidase domain